MAAWMLAMVASSTSKAARDWAPTRAGRTLRTPMTAHTSASEMPSDERFFMGGSLYFGSALQIPQGFRLPRRLRCGGSSHSSPIIRSDPGGERAMSNERPTRRQFVGATGAAIAGLAGAPWRVAAMQPAQAAAVADPRDADLIVFNAKVYTVDAAMPRAEAFAVKAGRFAAVGTTADMKVLAGKSTQMYDAKQMTVVPGFIDCHNHAPGNVLLYEVIVGNPYEVEFVTIRSIVDKLRAKARETPPGTWVEGYFFDDTKVKDKRALNVHDLDEVSKEHPVVVQHRGGHTSFYNT